MYNNLAGSNGNFRMLRLPLGRSIVRQIPARASIGPISITESDLGQSRGLSKWDGSGSQQDFMIKDQCITVNDADEVLGHASKYDVHRFNPDQPQGVLHRAFSVFLFSQENKLLLQQRAAGKVTFPNVWTNTCCSHQLSGQEPPEIDDPARVVEGSAEGAKIAAVRKLEHELGIPPSQLPAEAFKFLTRLHYCAADVHPTTGEPSGWGEHEMDYILFAKADVDLSPNPEEVQAVVHVDEAELLDMMRPSSGLLWSPWFRIIVKEFLKPWWSNLDQTLRTDDKADWQRIHHISE